METAKAGKVADAPEKSFESCERDPVACSGIRQSRTAVIGAAGRFHGKDAASVFANPRNRTVLRGHGAGWEVLALASWGRMAR